MKKLIICMLLLFLAGCVSQTEPSKPDNNGNNSPEIVLPDEDNEDKQDENNIKDGEEVFSINTDAELMAIPTSSIVLIDGKEFTFDAYNIESNNYFKLCDLALALNGGAKQFSVKWDKNLRAIWLVSNESYTAIGSEMSSKGTGEKKALPTDSSIIINQSHSFLSAYNISGNNYFKLRDIGMVFDFYVEYDKTCDTIIIETSKGYLTPYTVQKRDESTITITCVSEKTISNTFEEFAVIDKVGITHVDGIGTIPFVSDTGGEYYGTTFYQLIENEIKEVGFITGGYSWYVDYSVNVINDSNCEIIAKYKIGNEKTCEIRSNFQLTNIRVTEIPNVGRFVFANKPGNSTMVYIFAIYFTEESTELLEVGHISV